MMSAPAIFFTLSVSAMLLSTPRRAPVPAGAKEAR